MFTASNIHHELADTVRGRSAGGVGANLSTASSKGCPYTNAKSGTSAQDPPSSLLIHRADPDEHGYWVEVPALPGRFTIGNTWDEAIKNAHEATQCYLEGLEQAGDPIPTDPRLEPLASRGGVSPGGQTGPGMGS